ncbi:class I SAM-dependent methyltransferase [Actinomadura rubrisoli]|uniref:Class I SAM-dependent methyltransferase n=1 Tax=Actinomadura rubrisoli TaxID=2530368 RepID=A0A4R5A6J6_9ACTN|nr:class I SAM-dependent methyltransferase [Actinomadura rubrisoli]TDD67561.1 class I SAM-dependent methyltransferase [Actinomadura rubrisoli]
MDVRERWKSDRVQAAIYDFAVNDPTISRLGARLLWGYDIRHLWRSIGALEDNTTLDIPCGGGIAIRGNPRHVAADLSRTMLHRTRRKRAPLVPLVPLVQADINNLPFLSSTFDTCVTYNGLHCLPDPRRAVHELARVLRPGGTLRGTTLVRGAGRRYDALIALMRRRTFFGPTGTPSELHQWLTTAGLTDIRLTTSGAVTGFTARKPTDIEDAPPPSIR